ncbi:Nif3-like dinuclear metal center hexameric protein [Williamsia deligens]|uniref:GTP cyclohydrolase 1 type 2 homolog n=1 Tax=Williamsia deligens TaxID=321325 RepID=A0ABW3GA17_9NOCA|nr:Nif3-like dinuclear metal center hexameric protein [Williamsia deligens]MCP2195781.1 dinuclear metal center protein, YbgI/SA1388 family [Williamsia deligens]
MAAVGELVDLLDAHYPPHLAESWDSVGLVCGDPLDTVTAVLVCVDVTDAVVDHAIAHGIELVVAHHPLLLRGVDTVGAHTPKGRIIHRLVRAGCALYTAHTNADIARPGVSDALADALGVLDTRPLQPTTGRPLDKWVVFVPVDDTEAVADAMFRAGAGSIGDYSRCRWQVTGTGGFLPGDGATPHIGTVGEQEEVTEDRVEMVADPARREAIRAALRDAHPYEEPAYDVLVEAAPVEDRGLGRVGRLAAPTTLGAFAEHVAASLRLAPWGVRVAGDPDTEVTTVAVCGGAGDSLLDEATASGAHVYVTADLRHHPADEHLRAGGPALVDAGHWATEFPWCAQVAGVVRGHDASLVVDVFTAPTDPFTVHAAGETDYGE